MGNTVNGFFLKMVLVAVFLAVAGCGDQSQRDAASYQEGIDAYAKGNFAIALEKLKPLAEHGNAQAQFHLGMMYRQGNGLPQDNKEAGGWLNKAAEQGHVESQENLALMYSQGQGVAQDWVQADKWFSIAALSGKETAVNNQRVVELHLPPEKIAEAKALAQEWLATHKK